MPGDFAADTAVEPVAGAPGRYRATLSPEWEVWGPLGGYVAATALRAMGAATELPRPASFQCAFLSVGRFEPVEIPAGKYTGCLKLRVTTRAPGRTTVETLWLAPKRGEVKSVTKVREAGP